MQSIIEFFKENTLPLSLVIAAGILITTYLLSRLLPKFEKLFVRYITGKTSTTLDDLILKITVNDLRKLIWLVGFYFVLKNLNFLHETVLIYGIGILYVLSVLIVAHLITLLLNVMLDWYSEKWGKRVHKRVQDEFGPLLKRLIGIFVYTIAIVMILHHFKQNVSSILVSLGVGSLALALAAKDTLANMIAGFMIMTDRPFRIKDRIMLESGEKGDVYDIGLRSTKILTFDNTLIVVPNQQIVNEKVTNLSYPDPQIRVSVEVGVAYGTDLDNVKQILIGICEANPNVLDEPAPKAYFVNFGDSSLDFKVVCRVAEWGQQWGVAEELRLGIKQAFEKEGIEIPFPQRDINVKGSGKEE